MHLERVECYTPAPGRLEVRLRDMNLVISRLFPTIKLVNLLLICYESHENLQL